MPLQTLSVEASATDSHDLQAPMNAPVTTLQTIAHARTHSFAASKGKRYAVAAFTAGAVANACAQTVAAVDNAQTVVISGRSANLVGIADSSAEGTITAAQLADRPLLRPAEVLESVPGLIITQHSGDGNANQYFLRGFNLDHGTDFATYVNGMPINEGCPQEREFLHVKRIASKDCGKSVSFCITRRYMVASPRDSHAFV